MPEDRHLAHFVDVGAVVGRALFALTEEIDPHRLPIGADQVEHERTAIGVAGLRESIELVLGHDVPLLMTATCVPICGSDLATPLSQQTRACPSSVLWISRSRINSAGKGSRRARLVSAPYFIVGMTNSAPSLMPDGQREVTVFVLV